jgi:uncharacterized RDD family membrane protein YckC
MTGISTLPVRIQSMIIDQMIIIFVAMICMLPVGLFLPLNQSAIEKTIPFKIAAALIWAIILNKDCIRSRSPGKIKCNLQVFDKKGRVAHPFQCLVRNLTVFVWPIEVVMVLANPKRRFGDFLAGTNVQDYAPELANKPNLLEIILIFAGTFISMLIIIQNVNL